ncbi:HlyD family efflux transporter periplasmic adaptor subunit [Phaeovulum sp. NW3]|uniref:efflux RND transporter periplasmic adaptor subunit n=1 Tax=Phaeovulum sp. NW3 TaxID=2934933 RepID=UPI002020E251|nr:HlyD family efflux transporter periplasmic adaptor subunit [Phaeovulum sp. NW3]MCL7466538.1 HlyD family efflux transporter periplasmic adaptor subunit [Phaeovulum sp. NW3]
MSDDKIHLTGRSGDRASVAYLDLAHWRRLLEAESDDAALSSWLALQCGQIPSATRAVVVMRRNGPFRPVAFWPEEQKTSRFLMETVNEALRQRIDLVREDKDTPDTVCISRLVRQGSRIVGVVGLEAGEKAERARQEILRRLQWGSAWIEVFERRRAGQSDEHAIERLTLALDPIAIAGEHRGFRAAAAATLTSLSVQAGAARVSFGVRGARGCKVVAVSNTIHFDRRVVLVRAIAEAMDEAVDQAATVTAGHADEDPIVVSRQAKALAAARGGGVVVAQPYVRDGKPAGAFVFEWPEGEPPPDHIREAVPDIAALLGPVLHDRWRDERWLSTRAFEILGRYLAAVVGPGHLRTKATLLVLAGIAAFLAVFTTDFRVTADARLRGAVERVVMAPMDGYIVEAAPRAGDRVTAGTQLVKLDDVEFQLELYAWTARKMQYETELSQALAAFDRAGINILRARIREAEAQIALNETRIALTRIEAPFDAIIVSGDLSQSLGQTVQRGGELFRLAPLDSYLIDIDVPENDITFVEPGDTGALLLTSLPDTNLSFAVQNVTPVTSAHDGRNHFLVEATLTSTEGAPVSPGMEGVAKIEVGRERLVWIWTRGLVDWLRLAWWRWAP